jgi:serine/threonine protein kinase
MPDGPLPPESAPFGDPDSTQVDSRQVWPGVADARATLSSILDPPKRERDAGTFRGWPVLGLIGAGGMALVLRGIDERLKRDVAIKVVRPEYAGNRQVIGRFAREARLTAQVRHENVVVVYSVVDNDPTPYLIIEYLQGGTLQNRLRRDRLPEAECLDLTLQIAAGLQAAHAVGLLHRDIKPSNIGFRNSFGPAVLMDFGLARTLSDTDPITEHGSLVGTPGYMSPEQVQMQPLDVRSDLFSVGAMLYQMATGRMPFPGDTAATICHAVVHTNPPPAHSICPDVSPGLSKIIERLLHKDPQRRFASAHELSLAIKGLGQARPKVIPKWPFGVAAACMTMAALWVGVQWRQLNSGPANRSVVTQALLNAPSLTPPAKPSLWRLNDERRPGRLSEAGEGWSLENDKPEYDWVMAEAELPFESQRERFLLFRILEVEGGERTGWAVKLADPHGGYNDLELQTGRETGAFAAGLPTELSGNRHTVRMFAEGPQGARLRFADVRFVDAVPESHRLLAPLP